MTKRQVEGYGDINKIGIRTKILGWESDVIWEEE